MRLSLYLIGLIISTSVFSTTSIIYGDDDRKDLFEVKDKKILTLARSTAAMMRDYDLESFDDINYKVIASSLADNGICSWERFVNQPSVSTCTGFLVGPKLLVTAGHCVEDQQSCHDSVWVFDYKMDYRGQKNITVPKSSVYKCSKLIKQVYNHRSMMDYALIELKKEVKDRKPLKYRTSGRITINSKLFTVGHPSGLPTKVTDNATIRKINRVYLSTNLDTFSGSSGSPVFNATTYEVEGILVRGDKDYLSNDEHDCNYSNRVSEYRGRGEDVTLITNISELPNMQVRPMRRRRWWRRFL